jgi:sigma-B regulation protein RsbU (phosphoserine phosphatase)
MESAATPRILLGSDAPAGGDDLGPLLERSGYQVTRNALNAALPASAPLHDLVVLDGNRWEREARQHCRQLRAGVQTGAIPVLLVTGDHSPAGRLAALDAGADAYLLRPFLPAEFLAQVRGLLRDRALHVRLADRTAELRRTTQQLQTAYQQIDQGLEIARRIQQSGLPPSLPILPGARFTVYHRPSGRAAGDCYDLFRVADHHVALYLADVMGHGIAAALLGFLLRQSVQPNDGGKPSRLHLPDQVLDRINRDLLGLALAEEPFVSMVYVLFDAQDGTLRFARAGHPPPLHVPRDGDPRLWQLPGNLLGVFDSEFCVQVHRLQPGDKVIFTSDGIDGSLAEDQSPRVDPLLASAARHRTLPLEEFIAHLAEDLGPQTNPAEDFTLLGIERTSDLCPCP